MTQLPQELTSSQELIFWLLLTLEIAMIAFILYTIIKVVRKGISNKNDIIIKRSI